MWLSCPVTGVWQGLWSRFRIGEEVPCLAWVHLLLALCWWLCLSAAHTVI